MTQAAFSFIGTEIVAVRVMFLLSSISCADPHIQIAAGEAKNPRRNLPKAIKRVYIRILLFYIGGWFQSQSSFSSTHSVLLGTLIIGLLVPSNAEGLDLGSGDAASSPFVIAIQNAGIKALPSV